MPADPPARPVDRGRRRLVGFLLASGVAPIAACAPATTAARGEGLGNPFLWAVAWKRTAAEFGALCHQAYNLARLRVETALGRSSSADRPLAVIVDLDDTIFHAGSYWGRLIEEGYDFFDDPIWDAWLPEHLVTAVPGSLDFCRFCVDSGVEVFYVTNRDQGERTYDYALRQLELLGFPFADQDHLTVYRDTSDKTPAREDISARYEVVVTLGDNLNDYKRDYYVADVEERYGLMERDRAEYGDTFILLPNPTDGHWVRAIFGDSEPEPTDENRRLLLDAATGSARNEG